MTRFDATLRDALEAAGLTVWVVDEVVNRALDEDLGAGIDVTTAATIPAEQQGSAVLVPRADGVVAGLPIAAWVFDVVMSDGVCTTEFVAAAATDGDPA